MQGPIAGVAEQSVFVRSSDESSHDDR